MAGQRKKAMTAAFAALRVVVAVLIAAAFVYAGKQAYSFGYRVFAEETVSDPPGKKVAVTLEDGISAKDLAARLKEKRLIKDETIFWVQYQLSQYKGKLKGGTYVLNTSQTSEEMLEEMAGVNETEEETGE